MEQYRYISVQQILDNLTDHPLLKDLTLERVVHYALRLMKIVGCPVIFQDKVAKISYTDYKAPLPCDLYQVIQIKSVKHHRDFCYRYTTDNFHLAVKDHDTPCHLNDFTYKIQGSHIFFSKENDDVEISYRAIPVDENNMPMIVDNEAFLRALESYIKYERFKILRDTGEMDLRTFKEVEKEYFFEIAQASNQFLIPSVDQMESITNMWTSLLPRINPHDNGFREYSRKEYLRNI